MNKRPEPPSKPLRMRRTSPLFTLAALALLALFTLLGLSSAPRSIQAQAQTRAPVPTLDRLLRGFAAMSGLSARFVEEKQIALLARPVRSEGVLYFAPPGRLIRRVTAPSVSAALIEGDTLTFVADGRREQIPLGSNEVVGGFVASFQYVLAGDRAALERIFELHFEALGGQRWRLRLRPRTDALRHFLSEMELVGEGPVVETMVMREASGDVTTTTFHDVDTQRRFSAREQRELFRL